MLFIASSVPASTLNSPVSLATSRAFASEGPVTSTPSPATARARRNAASFSWTSPSSGMISDNPIPCIWLRTVMSPSAKTCPLSNNRLPCEDFTLAQATAPRARRALSSVPSSESMKAFIVVLLSYHRGRQTTDGRRRQYIVVHRPSSIVHRPSSIVHRPSSIVHRPSSVARRLARLPHWWYYLLCLPTNWVIF